MDRLLEYHAGFLVCKVCGRADPLPISIMEEGGFQMRLPEGYELRRYKLGATEVWAICAKCLETEPFVAPTCIVCGQPLSGHEPTCKTLVPEDGNVSIAAMAEILDGRTNLDWEIWDFVERVLVAHYETEEEAKAEIIRLYEAQDPKTTRVRYFVLEPHNLVRLDEHR